VDISWRSAWDLSSKIMHENLNKARSFLLIYTGGTEAAFYRMVRLATPQEPGPCGQPVVHDDGRIEYPEGTPPDINGYDRVAPRIFRPAWPSCRWRALTVSVSNGCFTITASCQHPLARHHLQDVLPDDCGACKAKTPIPGPVDRS